MIINTQFYTFAESYGAVRCVAHVGFGFHTVRCGLVNQDRFKTHRTAPAPAHRSKLLDTHIRITYKSGSSREFSVHLHTGLWTPINTTAVTFPNGWESAGRIWRRLMGRPGRSILCSPLPLLVRYVPCTFIARRNQLVFFPRRLASNCAYYACLRIIHTHAITHVGALDSSYEYLICHFCRNRVNMILNCGRSRGDPTAPPSICWPYADGCCYMLLSHKKNIKTPIISLHTKENWTYDSNLWHQRYYILRSIINSTSTRSKLLYYHDTNGTLH